MKILYHPAKMYDPGLAYSVRRVISGYAGYCMKVRRESDNALQDIGFSGDDLDETSLLSFVGAGGNGYVHTWYDQSGNGRDAVQSADNTRQPAIVLNGTIIDLNTKPGLLFDGSNDLLICSTGLDLLRNVYYASSFSVYEWASKPSTNRTVFIVMTPSYELSRHNLTGGYEGGKMEVGGRRYDTGASAYKRAICDIDITPFAELASGFLKYRTQMIYLYLNGQLRAYNQDLEPPGGYTSNTNSNSINIGASGTTSGYYFDGKISEIIIYPHNVFNYKHRIHKNIMDYYQITTEEVQPDPNTDFILEAYPNAACAYSLRLLDSGYEGYCIKVRRSSDNTTQDIGFNADNEMDVDALLTFIAGYDGFIDTWYDQSGNGRNAVQSADTTRQPKIVDQGAIMKENWRPCLLFDGSNDYLNIGNYPMYSNTYGMTIMTVNRITKNTGNIEIIAKLNASTAKRQWGLYSDNFNIQENANSYNGNNIASFTIQLTQKLYFCVWKPATYTRAYINTSLAGQATTPATDITTTDQSIMIGFSFNGYYGGNMQEIIIWPTDKLADKADIETRVMDYYNL